MVPSAAADMISLAQAQSRGPEATGQENWIPAPSEEAQPRYFPSLTQCPFWSSETGSQGVPKSVFPRMGVSSMYSRRGGGVEWAPGAGQEQTQDPSLVELSDFYSPNASVSGGC